MKPTKDAPVILVADDDRDDIFLIEEAFKECGIHDPLYHVEDGEELMDYLCRRGSYADPAKSPSPDLILLDINMPRKSGHEVLREVREDPRLKGIPVVIIATSEDDRDIQTRDQWEVRDFVTKPESFDELVAIIRARYRKWLSSKPSP